MRVGKDTICLHVLPYRTTDAIRRGQFALDNLPVQKLKAFIRALFNLNIEGAHVWFEKHDPNSRLRMEDDKDMDLDNFLSGLSKPTGFIRLQTGDPSHDFIRFMAADRPKDDGITHYVWFECDLTPRNYKKVDNEFKKAFGFYIKEIC